jgi:alkaline phosphatase D
MTQALRKHRVANAVLLGGDVHENWVGHVKADYADSSSATLGVEFCGTSITSRASGNNDHLARQLSENPHFVFADTEQRGYGLLDLTPAQLTTRLRVLDYVTRRDAAIRTLASFQVRAGRPLLLRA